MKQTTPAYGEEKTGKSKFEVKVSQADIAPMKPGCNKMLYDIYLNLQSSYRKDPETLLDFYNHLLEMAEHQPDGSYYSNWIVSHNYKEPRIVIKKDDLIKQIKELIKNHPAKLEVYRKEKQMQKDKEKEEQRTYIVSRLLDLETTIGSGKVLPQSWLSYIKKLKKIKSILSENFMSFDKFNINGKEFTRHKVRQFALYLLEEAKEQLQAAGINVEEPKKDSPKR